jgi:hypothetical protein
MRLQQSAWIAVRCFEPQPDGRVRFAHTGPFHVVAGDEPSRVALSHFRDRRSIFPWSRANSGLRIGRRQFLIPWLRAIMARPVLSR